MDLDKHQALILLEKLDQAIDKETTDADSGIVINWNMYREIMISWGFSSQEAVMEIKISDGDIMITLHSSKNKEGITGTYYFSNFCNMFSKANRKWKTIKKKIMQHDENIRKRNQENKRKQEEDQFERVVYSIYQDEVDDILLDKE